MLPADHAVAEMTVSGHKKCPLVASRSDFEMNALHDGPSRSDCATLAVNPALGTGLRVTPRGVSADLHAEYECSDRRLDA